MLWKSWFESGKVDKKKKCIELFVDKVEEHRNY
jgi:hypothetical protein